MTDDLDPGIALTVAWLNAKGFTTTDSGDGVSKFRPVEGYPNPKQGDALPFPHVAITPDGITPCPSCGGAISLLDTCPVCKGAGGLYPKDRLCEEADNLRRQLILDHCPLLPGDIQASYDPVDKTVLIMLMMVSKTEGGWNRFTHPLEEMRVFE